MLISIQKEKDLAQSIYKISYIKSIYKVHIYKAHPKSIAYTTDKFNLPRDNHFKTDTSFFAALHSFLELINPVNKCK